MHLTYPRHELLHDLATPDDSGVAGALSWNKVWHRRTQDVNKELADDLRGRLTVKVGGFLIHTPGYQIVGQKKKRM